jgi:hypothetical protein
MISDPNKCMSKCVDAHPYSPRVNKLSDSAEKVENVVKLPKKPVIKNNLSSGLIMSPKAIKPILKPIK